MISYEFKMTSDPENKICRGVLRKKTKTYSNWFMELLNISNGTKSEISEVVMDFDAGGIRWISDSWGSLSATVSLWLWECRDEQKVMKKHFPENADKVYFMEIN